MAITGYGNLKPGERVAMADTGGYGDPIKTPPLPKAPAPKPTPTQSYGYGSDEYYRQYYANMLKQAEAQQRAAQEAAARAQAEYLRQQQIQMREQPQQQTGYGLPASDANAPVIRNTMPNMTQLAPPVIRQSMPEMPNDRLNQPAWSYRDYLNQSDQRDTSNPLNRSAESYRDYLNPPSINATPNWTHLPYYDNPIARGYAQGLANFNPEVYDYTYNPVTPSSYYGPSEWINPQYGPPEPRTVKNLERTRNAINDIMAVDFTYNPAIEETPMPDVSSGGWGFDYPKYSSGGWGNFPSYEQQKPAKTWYENMLQWNIR